jgi:prephenate dehydrogenase
MNVLVVGAGTMGQWLGRVLAEASQSTTLAVTDADAAIAREAADRLDCRVHDDDTETYDLVCLAVPMPAVEDAIAAYAPLAERAVVDVTGTMREPLAAMAEHAPACGRASVHPLFAPENEPGSVPIVVDSEGPEIETVRAALAARGNHVFETTAEAHDEAMETVQAKTHAAVLAFGLAADDVDPAFHTPVSGVLAELLDQVTGGSPGVYADIQQQFAGADDVAEAAAEIARADRDRFEHLYETATPDGGGRE